MIRRQISPRLPFARPLGRVRFHALPRDPFPPSGHGPVTEVEPQCRRKSSIGCSTTGREDAKPCGHS